eukprot:6123568-Amphidinium_carterae.1
MVLTLLASAGKPFWPQFTNNLGQFAPHDTRACTCTPRTRALPSWCLTIERFIGAAYYFCPVPKVIPWITFLAYQLPPFAASHGDGIFPEIYGTSGELMTLIGHHFRVGGIQFTSFGWW